MTNIQETYLEKLNRFDSTQRGQLADRVPVFSLVDNWAFSYAGYTLAEIIQDDKKQIDAFVKVAEDFYWDAMFTCFTSKSMNFINALGGGIFRAAENMQIETGHANVMDVSEYDDLIADPYAFIRNVIAPRKSNLMKEPYSDSKQMRFNAAIDFFLKHNKSTAEAIRIFTEELGMPLAKGGGGFVHPVDLLLDFLRDFSGIMLDVKRNPNKVIEAADAMVPMIIELVVAGAPVPRKGTSVFNPMHLPQFLRPKDFEKIYWPSYKEIIETLSKKGYIVNCYYERDYTHLHEYLQELPAHSVFGLFEKDDLRVVKQKLGKTMCIGGGMEAYMLKNATKQKCLDTAKALIDDLAPGGNYVFTTDNLLHAVGEVNPENLRAVNEFVHEYAVYK